MFGRLRNSLYSALGNGEEEGGSQTTVSSSHSQSRPKYPYQRPAFLNLSTADEIQVTADHSVRPIIVPRDVNSLPWSAGYAETINAGKSRFNEDQACVKEGRVSFVSGGKMTHIPYTLFSVYDGHAGAGCAVSASNDLWQVIQARLESVGPQLLAGLPPEGGSAPGFDQDTIWPGSTSRNISTESLIIGALETAFWETDQFIGEEKKVYHMPGGCTVLVALFILGKLYVANAGDSRSVLCRQNKAYPMSYDFTPVTERQRLQTIGRLQPHLLGDDYNCLEYCRKPSRRDIGSRILYRDAFMTGWAYKVVQETDMKFPMVFGEGKRSRLLATIGVTRGFGDHDLRAQSTGTVYIKPFLTPQPEVRVLDIENELVTADDILVLGTDGLWDVVSNEEVASIVQRGLSASWDNEMKAGRYRYISLAQDLVMSARGKLKERNWKRSNGSPATIDDITVFVIPILPYKHEYLGVQNGENEELHRCENGTDAMDIEARDSSPEKQAAEELDSSPDKSEAVEDRFGGLRSGGSTAAGGLDADSTELGAVPGIPCVADLTIAVSEEAAVVVNADKKTLSTENDTHNKELKMAGDSAEKYAVSAAMKHCDNITTHSNSDLDADVLCDGVSYEVDGVDGLVGDDDGLGSKLVTPTDSNKVINDESD